MKAGYSERTIADNIAALVRLGIPGRTATYDALCFARKSYFAKFPHGALPLYLSYQGARLKSGYDAEGRISGAGSNPVSPLPASTRSRMATIQNDIDDKLSARGASVRKAAALYTSFTGHEKINLTPVKIPAYPAAVVRVGVIDGIKYTTKRDGVIEHYEHLFKKSAKPNFCVSPDGLQIFIVGGNFEFTDRGIVDD